MISQFLQFFIPLHLRAMKALRIKTLDYVLNLSRFQIVLLKEVVSYDLMYLNPQSEAIFQLDLINGEQFLLRLACDETEFEKFKGRWGRFQENEENYFDLSAWGQ